MAAQGGHDEEFVCQVPGRFLCHICAKVLREPHLAVCCGQHFCESCLKQWLKQYHKQSCPHCRTAGKAFNHVINKGLRSEINQLKIMCSNHAKGCLWTGELGALKTHLESDQGCGFVEVNCPNRCYTDDQTRTSILRNNLVWHLAAECCLRQYQCEHCGHKDTYYKITGRGSAGQSKPAMLPCKPLSLHVSELTLDDDFQPTYEPYSGHFHFEPLHTGAFQLPSWHVKETPHYDVCPEFPLTCPNKCGAWGIKRKNMVSHRSECPQEPAKCPFAEVGCKEDLRRCHLEGHMTSSVQQHLLLVMNDHKKVKERLKETEAKLRETEMRCRGRETFTTSKAMKQKKKSTYMY